MNADRKRVLPNNTLRRRAEARIGATLPGKKPAERRGQNDRLLHELQVHKIEVEMQNHELREAQIRLGNLLKEYTDLYDFAPVGYLTLNRLGEIRRLNLKSARLLGADRKRLLERQFALFIAMGDRAAFSDFLNIVFSTDDLQRCEATLVPANARPIIVQFEGVRGLSHQECRVAMFDITEQKRSEQQRSQQTSRQLAEIVESSSDAIMSATLKGVVTSWNTAAERIYGYPASEVIGQTLLTVAPADRQVEQRELFERVRRGETVEGFETLRRRKNGEFFPASITAFPIKNENGDIAGISCIIRDITISKTIECRLAELHEDERRKVGDELHDGLGQHLHALCLLSDLLQKDLKKERSSASTSATRLNTLLREAAAITRDIAHGIQPVLSVPEGLIMALRRLAARTSILYRLDCKLVCLTRVLVHNPVLASSLFRIAQEAVNNAVKHARPKHVRLTLREEAERIVLSIRDDGGGIRARQRAPRGIGLPLMQHRANLMGGLLAIRKLPHGTEVVCTTRRKGESHAAVLAAEEKP